MADTFEASFLTLNKKGAISFSNRNLARGILSRTEHGITHYYTSDYRKFSNYTMARHHQQRVKK